MTLLDAYIGRRILWGWLLVALLLTALFGFFDLASELDAVGEGRYRTLDAIVFIALTLPGRLAEMAAVSALLGSLLALGTLAAGHEMTALRAAGCSPWRVCTAVLGAGSLIVAGVILLLQFVIPPLERQGRLQRQLALAGAGTAFAEGGIWIRNGERIVHIGRLLFGGIPADVEILEFGEQGRLRRYIEAHEAQIAAGRWRLTEVRQKIFSAEGIENRRFPVLTEEFLPGAGEVNLLGLLPESLAPSDLYQLTGALRQRGQNAERYALAFWQKVALPLKTVAMFALAVPFFYGPVRRGGVGGKILAGGVVGVGFYFFDRVFGYLGLLVHLPPALVSLAPAALIALSALILLQRRC